MTTTKKTALFIEGNRTGYSPDQVERRSLTIHEMIEMLEQLGEDFGMDAKVFIRNDNGYTYGEVGYRDLNIGWYDGDHVGLGDPDDEYDAEW